MPHPRPNGRKMKRNIELKMMDNIMPMSNAASVVISKILETRKGIFLSPVSVIYMAIFEFAPEF
jgi:hypothetical protein